MRDKLPVLVSVLRFHHFWHDVVQLTLSVLFQHHISKLPRYFITKVIAAVYCSMIRWNVVLVLNTVKSTPVTGLEWTKGFQEFKVPRFYNNSTGWW